MHAPPSLLGFKHSTVSPTRPTETPTSAATAVRPPVQAPSHHLRHVLTVILLSVVLGVAAWFVHSTWQLGQVTGPLTASGTTEAEEVLVASEVTGRILTLPFDEGARVRAGDVLATLDDSLLRLQFTQSDAATQRQLDIQLGKLTLHAPSDGTVTRVPARIGEVAMPGQPLLAFADLRSLKVTVYILERDLGGVRVGQQVLVTSDPFPGRSFHGVVTSINQRAEFTPRNIQTVKDRLNLVFGVKVRVDNPDYALKPGMPVDGTFQSLDDLPTDATVSAAGRR